MEGTLNIYKKLLYLLVCYFLTIFISDAKILIVPEEFASIQSAIDVCDTGDVVSIKPGNYAESLNLSGKNLEMRGRDQGSVTIVDVTENFFTGDVITVINSDITLKNINIKSRTADHLLVVFDCNLKLVNCAFDNDRSYAYQYEYSNPNCKEPLISLINCQNRIISFDHIALSREIPELFSSSEFYVGIESCRNTTCHFNHVTMSNQNMGFQFALYTGFFYSANSSAWNGILITDSDTLRVFFENTIIGGIDGNSAANHSNTHYEPSPGGIALVIDHSSATIWHGIFIGGKGGIDYPAMSPLDIPRGASGGDGLQVLNHSTVRFYDIEAKGGSGGTPNGTDGLPIVIDSTSTVENLSLAQGWLAY